jgi:hypothetical protein
LSADGCFSADAALARWLEEGGAAESSGESSFSATYSLEKATVFSLNLDLAQWGETDLSFRAVDDATGEVLFNCETISGVSRHLEMTGVLDAGQYTFELDGDAYAMIDSTGAWDAAGMASYNVALDFAAESYWVTVGDDGSSGVILMQDNDDDGSTTNGCIVKTVFSYTETRMGDDEDAYYADRLFSVPEATGQSDVFFAWTNITTQTPQIQWWAIDAIEVTATTPEPGTLTLLLLGLLAALALFRRK